MDQAELLGLPPDKRKHAPDWYNLYAKKTLGVTSDWAWFTVEVIGYKLPRNAQAVRVVGAVPKIITRGKRKGQKSWRGRDKSADIEFVISTPAIDALKVEWERETGCCSTCGGSGEEFAGWSAANGSNYRPCKRCEATGNAPGAQP